jgi:uncharacterized protein YdiU (UPF0061 family)
MSAKLGVADTNDDMQPLVAEILRLLASERVDYTIFWRRLSQWVKNGEDNPLTAAQPLRDLFLDHAGIDSWMLQYSELLTHIPRGRAADLMLKNNPKYVLRNHLGEIAIQAAKTKDFSVVAQLLQVLERPFDEHPEFEAFADFPPDWAGSISISCSS